jgi:prepilin-type processing-associated H-X9-DG protein
VANAQEAESATNSVPDLAPRSFLMNGCQDYFAQPDGPPAKVQVGSTINENAMRHPNEAIVFGEKQSQSTQFYVLLDSSSAYLADLEESRHGGREGPQNRTGYSNYGFADGHVDVVRYGKALCPFNLWAVTDWGRSQYAVCRPLE